MTGKTSRMSKFADVAVFAAAGMVGCMLVFGLGPSIETWLFPVYSKFTLVSVERVPPNNSLVKATYTKYRDCVPIGAAWFNAPVARDLETGRQLEYIPRRQIGVARTGSKPVGKWEALPFELSATPEELASTVFAEVYSRCHPFWTTKSVIYP